MNKSYAPISLPRLRAIGTSIRLLAAVLALSVMTSRSLAINASPTPVQLKQPDGRSITLRVRGDEYCHWFEDLNGYSVVLNKGAYVYAVRDTQGGLAPTALAVGVADPASSNVTIKSGPTPAFKSQKRAAVLGPPRPRHLRRPSRPWAQLRTSSFCANSATTPWVFTPGHLLITPP